MKLLIVTIFLTSIYACLSGQSLSPGQEPGVNNSLTDRLVIELRYAYYQDSIRVMPTTPTQEDFSNFDKAKTLIDFADVGISNMKLADSLFSAYMGGRCIVRMTTYNDFIYGNKVKSQNDMKSFLGQGVRQVSGIVYKYKNSDQVLVCTYEKK